MELAYKKNYLGISAMRTCYGDNMGLANNAFRDGTKIELNIEAE